MHTALGCDAVFSRNHRLAVFALFCFSASLAASRVVADENNPKESPSISLANQIDALLEPMIPHLVSAKDSDGVLLRRLSLDLRGVVPTREELNAFAADASPDRWSTWADKFLGDPLCDEHLVTFLDRTLMLRRPYSHVDRVAWINYLRDHVAADTPLDVLSRELLFTPWWNLQHRPAQRFYLDRAGDPHLITRDLARVFLGRDLQCAQCHDHPLVDDFRQVDYHGLLAFVSAGSLVEVSYKDAEDKDQKVQLYMEKASGDAPFESVFERGTMLRSGTRLAGQPESLEPYDRPDQRYVAEAPEGALAGVALPPKSSRREQLAQRLANRDNAAFVSNWANRLWALIYGRGLVHPLDMIEPDNPPSNEALFELIADGLLQADMRLKPFLKQLVLTQAYQRGGTPPLAQIAVTAAEAPIADLRPRLDEQITQANANIEALSAAEANDLQAYEAAREAWLKVQADRAAARIELDAVEAALLDAKKKHDESSTALATAQQKLNDGQTRTALLDESAAKLEQALTLAGGEDAELSQAIAVAKQRGDAARGQSPELEKAVGDAQSAATATMTVLEQAGANVDQAVEKLKPIHVALLNADEATVAAREKWTHAHSTLVAARRELSQTKHLLGWIDELSKADRLANALSEIESQRLAVQHEADQTLSSIETVKTNLANAETAVRAANDELAKAKSELEQHRQVIDSLEKTIVSLADATKLVSKAETLRSAQDSLREEIAAKQGQLGQLQSKLDSSNAKVSATTASLSQQQSEFETLTAKHQALAQQLVELQERRNDQQAQLESTNGQVSEQLQVVTGDCESQLATAGLFPLSAEQLCWSTLRVTGVLDAYIRTEVAELDKQSPLPADADEAAKSVRQRQAVRQAIEKLRGIADQYASLYASGPDKTQDDYFASADQALYVSNGGSVFSWAGPGNNNPTQVATGLTDAGEVAKTLYWSYLCRQPTAQEIAMVAEQLDAAGDQRNTIIHELAWSLLASVEFRFTR